MGYFENNEPDNVFASTPLKFELAKSYAKLHKVIAEFEYIKESIETIKELKKKENEILASTCPPFKKSLIQMGLWSNSVTTYAKFFIDTSFEKGRLKLEKNEHLKGLSPEHIEYHNKIIDMRHNMFSHNKSNSYESEDTILYFTDVESIKKYKIIFKPSGRRTINLPIADLEKFILLVDHIVSILNIKANKLQQKVKEKIESEGFIYNELFKQLYKKYK